MPRQRQTYRQLPIPFPSAELAQPARPVLPPGLRELQVADGLSDDRVQTLAEMWPTIRGDKPRTVATWREFCLAVKLYR